MPTPNGGGASGLVDAHHHFWRTSRHHDHWRDAGLPSLARDFEPADLAGDLAKTGVVGTVLIQSLDEPAENDAVLEYAASTPHVVGVVGWLPLDDPDQGARELDRLAAQPVVRGVRCLIGRHPADWLVEAPALDLLRALARQDLAWDIVPVTPGHVAHVCRIAEAVPDLRIVVDHLARPPLDEGGWEPWASGITRLASYPNVALKASVGVDVLTRWERWEADQLGRYVRHALTEFGPERVMLASNWPVILVRRTYADVLADLTAAALDGAGLGESDLAELRAGTARRWYRLPA